MSRYRFEIDNVRAHVHSLLGVIAIQVIVIAGLVIGWSRAPRQITVHLPPDLRSGAILALDEVPPANVYAFASTIFQQLNRWPEDGTQDYGRAIFRTSAYLTPKYRAFLMADLAEKARQGELTYRVRGVQPLSDTVFADSKVDVLGHDVWIARLDLDLVESVKGMTVKHTTIRYPLRVVRQAVDLDANPWGLALDGYGAEGPRRLQDGPDKPIHGAAHGD